MKHLYLPLGLFVLIIIAVVLLTAGGEETDAPDSGMYKEGEMTLGEQEFSIQVADTIPARVQGLSGRETLAPYDGLLIVFGRVSADHSIWMKDMQFPLDLIWLTEGGEVVDLHLGLSPESYPATFHPDRPAYSVLEAAAGSVEDWEVEVGDRFEIRY